MCRFLLNILRLKGLFQGFVLRVVRGYIVHLVFEPQIGKNLPDIFHTENTHFDRVVSRGKTVTQP